MRFKKTRAMGIARREGTGDLVMLGYVRSFFCSPASPRPFRLRMALVLGWVRDFAPDWDMMWPGLVSVAPWCLNLLHDFAARFFLLPYFGFIPVPLASVAPHGST